MNIMEIDKEWTLLMASEVDAKGNDSVGISYSGKLIDIFKEGCMIIPLYGDLFSVVFQENISITINESLSLVYFSDVAEKKYINLTHMIV